MEPGYCIELDLTSLYLVYRIKATLFETLDKEHRD